MTPGVEIWRCTQCRTAYFPRRLLCARCHGVAFDPEPVHEGVVEEITIVRHMLGQENWQPRPLASVRTKNGPLITVGLRDESAPGAVVELFQEDAAPFGKAKGG
jgi:uncharacterized OB-fold protein